jgi:hypothetical protein
MHTMSQLHATFWIGGRIGTARSFCRRAAYAEFLVRPERSGSGAADMVRAFCFQHLRIDPLLSAMAEAAAALRARHASLRLPHALVLGTPQILGAGAIVTANARWSTFADNFIVLGTA